MSARSHEQMASVGAAPFIELKLRTTFTTIMPSPGRRAVVRREAPGSAGSAGRQFLRRTSGSRAPGRGLGGTPGRRGTGRRAPPSPGSRAGGTRSVAWSRPLGWLGWIVLERRPGSVVAEAEHFLRGRRDAPEHVLQKRGDVGYRRPLGQV